MKDPELAGIFLNGLTVNNHELSIKRPAEESKDKDEGADPRTSKIGKAIANIECDGEVEFRDNSAAKFQQVAAGATNYARKLCQTRGSYGDPAYMEKKVRELIKGNAKCQIEVLDAAKLQEQGMLMFWNVGKGAEVPPRCVIVKYTGNPDSDVVETALVGKGITYDTGGLNIKPTGGMEEMYGDKGGSCAVLGALKGVMELDLKMNFVFACAFADNAIGSKCFKPSDIIKAMNGLQVEIGNTDAEGRLVLGDTMTYVQRNYAPK